MSNFAINLLAFKGMDSITQITLGSAIGVAVMGRHTKLWKAALWGAVAGTTPDLDTVVRYGNDVLNMTRHRAESHAIYYLTCLSPILGLAVTGIHKEWKLYLRWVICFWLVFMTHIGIDYLTIYGTQLLQPFSNHPFGLGSIFIIDPAYTLPLLIGLMVTLIFRSRHRLRWNTIGLAVSSLYLAWGVYAQQLVTAQVKQDLPTDRIDHLMVSAGPLNSILWRVVAISPSHYYEAWVSLLDKEKKMSWTKHDRGAPLIAEHATNPSVASIQAFSHGIYRMHETPSGVYITDLRMGAEPSYFFDFNLGKPDARGQLDPNFAAIKQGSRPDIKMALPWVWSRIWDQQTPPPWMANQSSLNQK